MITGIASTMKLRSGRASCWASSILLLLVVEVEVEAASGREFDVMLRKMRSVALYNGGLEWER